MKISYRTHPILEKIFTGQLGDMGVAPEDYSFYASQMKIFDTVWEAATPEFSKNIQYLTTQFSEAVKLSLTKTIDENFFKNLFEKESYGTILYGAACLCYWFYPTKDNGFAQTYFAFKHGERGQPPRMEAFIHTSVDKDYKGTAAVYFPKSELKQKTEKEVMQFHNKVLTAILNFIKYAPIETKYLPAGQKVKGIDCKYVNDTKLDVTYLDSKWFTTLVKSDAFRVRGHFRLQPKKKDGEWTKELIWINEFQKTGYTAPARKLKEV